MDTNLARDLFFAIWLNDIGAGWLMFITLLFCLYLAFLFFAFARTMAKNNKFHKKHLIHLGVLLILAYQLIPISLSFKSIESYSDIKKSIYFKQLAIKTAIIPWQKGAYYCELAMLYYQSKNYEKMREAQSIAYYYLKSYDYSCWGMNFIPFYREGDYDTAIKIAQNFLKKHGGEPYAYIARCYLMKNDIKNADLYINKSLGEKETYMNLALKAYILKTKGEFSESLTFYEKAKSVCKNGKESNVVDETYKNFQEYESKKIRK